MNDKSVDCLDAAVIEQAMAPAAWDRLRQFTLLQETDSTNSYLMRLPAESRHAHAVQADRQTGGRGRREKTWHSPPAGNVYLSLGWQFSEGAWSLSTLPLVVAIAVCRALSRAGLKGHGIKWPNDILVGSSKLAGILVELQSPGAGPGLGPALAVIGIGLNVRMPDAAGDQLGELIDRPWTDLASAMGAGEGELNRNRLTAFLLDELLGALDRFEGSGFPAFRKTWQDLDLLRGKKIQVQQGENRITGEARGVDPNGGLLLDTGRSGMQVFHSGDVSVHL